MARIEVTRANRRDVFRGIFLTLHMHELRDETALAIDDLANRLLARAHRTIALHARLPYAILPFASRLSYQEYNERARLQQGAASAKIPCAYEFFITIVSIVSATCSQ